MNNNLETHIGFSYPVTIVVGRFQLPHKPHIHLIKTALEHGKRVVVLLGSAFHARTIKNCFTWSEREAMIRLCLTEDENARVTFVPIRDYNDNRKWYDVAKKKVHDIVGDVRDAEIRVVGFFKDASSAYLNQMPWAVIDAGSPMQIDATSLRTMLFESDDPKSTLAAMTPYVPIPVINYLKSWCCLPYLLDLKEEYNKITNENRTYGGKYGLTGDFLLEFIIPNDDGIDESYILLVKRGRWPGKGLYAIPGGFFEPDFNETLFQCALREAFEETQHDIWEPQLREAFVARDFFDAPDRSVRKNIKTMAHYFRMHGSNLPTIRGSVDPGESKPEFVKKSKIAEMESLFFDDHFSIIHHFTPFDIED